MRNQKIASFRFSFSLIITVSLLMALLQKLFQFVRFLLFLLGLAILWCVVFYVVVMLATSFLPQTQTIVLLSGVLAVGLGFYADWLLYQWRKAKRHAKSPEHSKETLSPGSLSVPSSASALVASPAPTAKDALMAQRISDFKSIFVPVDLTPFKEALLRAFETDDMESITEPLRLRYTHRQRLEGFNAYLPLAVDRLLGKIDEEPQQALDTIDSALLHLHDLVEQLGLRKEVMVWDTIQTLLRAVAEGYLERGEQPDPRFQEFFPDMPFLFQKDETFYYGVSGVSIYEQRTQTHYQSGSRGVSIRLMKGVYYHTGGSRGHRYSTEEQVLLSVGDIVVTSKHVMYSVDGRSTRIPLRKLVSVNWMGDSIELVKEAARPRPVTWTFSDTRDADLVDRLIKMAV